MDTNILSEFDQTKNLFKNRERGLPSTFILIKKTIKNNNPIFFSIIT